MSTLKQNLIYARSTIVFLIGLTLAFWLVYTLERWETEEEIYTENIENRLEGNVTLLGATPEIKFKNSDTYAREHRELTDTEREWAQTAWQYFENNYNAENGFVNSTDQYPATTMWDTSSYLLGLIAAQRLAIVEQDEFDKRVSTLLGSLATMRLFDDLLPNKAYNTSSLEMVTYDNEETNRGIGWSAIDVGRILVPLNILVWHFPQHSASVGQVLAHWDMDSIVQGAEMFGTNIDESGKTVYVQEGRLGYEEYAAKSLSLISRDVSKAIDYELNMELVDIYGIQIAADTREPAEFGALNYVVSEPYILDGIEYGWDRYSKELAKRVFDVQQRRYEETGILTAVSEDNIDQPPYFVYNTVFADGKPWNATTEVGEDASEFRTLSTKATIGFHALYENDYTEKLVAHVKDNFDAKLGWYSGIYEADGKPNKAITANTNGIILEALHYIQFGPMMTMRVNSDSQVAQAIEE